MDGKHRSHKSDSRASKPFRSRRSDRFPSPPNPVAYSHASPQYSDDDYPGNIRYEEITQDPFIGPIENPFVQSSTSSPLTAFAPPHPSLSFLATGARGASAQDAPNTHGPTDAWSDSNDQEMLYSPQHTQPPWLPPSMPSLGSISDHFSFVSDFPQQASVPLDLFPMVAEQSKQDSLSKSVRDSRIAPLMDFSDGPRSIFHEPISTELNISHRLEAPSALMKDADGIPTTYLNKASNYTVAVQDSSSNAPGDNIVMYRTTLHVEYDAEHQRQDPTPINVMLDRNRNAKTTEVLYSDRDTGRPPYVQCVEYHTSDHPAAMKDIINGHPSGFSILWNADPCGAKQCSIVIRMNFLSTDFTHVQGVKGDAIRLCIKTEVVSGDSEPFQTLPCSTSSAEYCRIKLFRSHGAERKMSNDMINGKKRIKGLEKQLLQSQTNQAMTEQDGAGQEGRKAEKGNAKRMARLEVGLHKKLARWNTLLGSSQEFSYFRRYDGRAPERVLESRDWALREDLEGGEDETQSLPRSLPRSSPHSSNTMDRSGSDSYLALPSTSDNSEDSMSEAVTPRRRDLQAAAPSHWDRASAKSKRQPIDYSKAASNIPPLDLSNPSVHQRKMGEIAAADVAGLPIKIPPGQGSEQGPRTHSGGGDESRPNQMSLGQSVSCFYIHAVEPPVHSAISNPRSSLSRSASFYTPIYVVSRTAGEFISVVAQTCGLDPRMVTECSCRTRSGAILPVDDEIVSQLPEGARMTAELHRSGLASAATGGKNDQNRSAVGGHADTVAIRLLF